MPADGGRGAPSPAHVVATALRGLPGQSVLVVDADLRILSVLGELAARIGLDPSDLGALAPVSMPDASWQLLRPAFESALAGVPLVLDVHPSDGTSTVWELTATPVTVGDGPVIGASVLVRDVTAIRDMRAELIRVAGEFESFVGTSTEGHYRIGPDGIVLWASPSMAVLTGKPMSQIVGIKARGVVHPDDVPKRDAAMAELLRTRQPQTFEVRGEHADGTWHWFEGTIRALFHDDGTVREFHNTTRDVTRRKAGDELRRQWQLSFESTNRGIVLLQPDCDRIVQVNPAFAAMHGGCPGDYVGLSLAGLVWRDSEPWPLDHDDAYVQTESVHVRSDGTTFPAEIEFVAPRDEDGRLLYRVGYVTDLTEQEALASAEFEARAVFSAAVDQAPIGMCLVSPEGRFLRVNTSLCKLLGRSEAELLAATFHEVSHPDDLAADLALVQEVLSGTRSEYEMQKRFLLPDGEVVTAWLLVSLIRYPDGAPAHFISQIVDLTEAQATEARLRVLEDRHRIAGAFHDHVVQRLFGAGLMLQGVEMAMGVGPHTERLSAAVNEIDGTIREIRSAIYDLRDSADAPVGLA